MSLISSLFDEQNWSKATPADLEILAEQLGRKPKGVVGVAQRCHFGRPQVIVNDPIPTDRGGVARPFPTLFWLTCPYLVKAVGSLEAAGWIDRLRRKLQASKGAAQEMRLAHEGHARLRLALCDTTSFEALSPDEQRVLRTSGIGGMRRTDGVKCLHAHLADYFGRRSGDGVNTLGRQTAGLLLKQGVDLKGSKQCAACDGCVSFSNEPIAAIDVGSNAVRMIVGRVEKKDGENITVDVTDRARVVTHLGKLLRDADSPDMQGQDGVRVTLHALRDFADRARSAGASVVVGAATAAVRESKCAEAFLVRVWEACGLSVSAIPGHREAELAFWGAVASLGDSVPNPAGFVTVVDVGGGSTEIVRGTWDGNIHWARSVPLGAVRCKLADDLGASLEESIQALCQLAKESFEKAGVTATPDGRDVVAVGGTAVTIASMVKRLEEFDPDAVHGTRIQRSDVDRLLQELAATPSTERALVPGLDPDRRDNILPGLAIVKALLEVLEAESMTVSEGGLLHGLIREVF